MTYNNEVIHQLWRTPNTSLVNSLCRFSDYKIKPLPFSHSYLSNIKLILWSQAESPESYISFKSLLSRFECLKMSRTHSHSQYSPKQLKIIIYLSIYLSTNRSIIYLSIIYHLFIYHPSSVIIINYLFIISVSLCICVCVYVFRYLPIPDRRQCQISWSWSYRWIRALGTELQFFKWAVNAL